jgi:hypothetical protein
LEPEPEKPEPIPTGIHFGEVFQTKPDLWYRFARKSKQVVLKDNARRFEHCYMRAASGGGKTNTLKHIIAQDLQDPKKGVIVLGPEPELFNDLLPYIPRERADDFVYFNPMDETTPIIGFNPFTFDDESNSPEERRKAVLYKSDEVTTILERALGELGVAMRPVVSSIARALVLLPEATINDVRRLLDLQDDSLRLHIPRLKDVPDDLARFWKEYDQNRAYRNVHDNVVNRFTKVFQPPISTVLSVNAMRWQELVQLPRIIFVDLSELPKGGIRETVAQLTLASIQTAFKRVERIPENQRVPYYLTMDEFDDFLVADDSLDEMFRQARKQRLSITIAHQTTDKVPQKLLGIITGNVATLIILRIADYKEASELAKNMQLHKWDSHLDREQIRKDMIRQIDSFEESAPRHHFTVPYHTPAEKAAYVERNIEDVIEQLRGSIDHTVLMNLDQGQSVVKLPDEKYGIGCRIPLFKKKGEARQLIAHSKKLYGVRQQATPGRAGVPDTEGNSGGAAAEDDDFLS